MMTRHDRESRRGAARLALAVVLILSGLVACRAAETPADAFTADLSQGEVTIALRAEPAQVRMDRDFLVTLRVTAPLHLKVTVPDLRDRFRGFRTAEGFARDPVPSGGAVTQEIRWRLVPDLQRACRLAPFAVAVADTRAVPPRVAWFATRAVVFPAAPPPAPVSGAPEVAVRPFPIRPAPRTVAAWAAGALLGAALLAAAILGARRLRRRARERRLSPAERAFAELDRLLRRNLVGRGLYKDFYIELTMVVRRYIERRHAVRAPEQTTEEFLAAAARHPRFPPEALARLREFLESSDLVKFAGRTATPATADAAVSSAREYLETDARTPDSGTRNPEPGTRNPEPGTRDPESGTRNPEPGTRDPEPGTRDPESGIRNPKP
jgi:hypothetical protein